MADEGYCQIQNEHLFQSAESRPVGKIKQYKVVATILFLLFCVCLVLLICAVVLKIGCSLHVIADKKTEQKSVINFLHISDLHLDLSYNSSTSSISLCRSLFNTTFKAAPFDAPYGRVGCDSSPALVQSSLDFMETLSAKRSSKFKFLLLTGDLVAHEINSDFPNGTTREKVLKNIKATSHKVGTTFSDVPVLPLFGNHDLPDDNVLPEGSKFYEEVLTFWQPLILCAKCSAKVTNEDELRKTFLVGGYYKAEFKEAKLTLLQVNSNYWVKDDAGAKILTIADAQMKWLSDQLKEARNSGNKVIIAGHIPPGIDAGGHFGKLWTQNYTQKYVEMVTKTYKDVLVGQLFGHIHKDDMRLQMLNDKVDGTDDYMSFLLMAPAITPMFRNNPGFRSVSYDTKIRMLTDYQQYFMDLVLSTQNKSPIWLFDYSFSDKYMKHLPEDERVINGKLMAEIVDNFINQTNEDRQWQNYIQHRQVNYQPDPYSRFVLYCAAKHVTKKAFDDCIKRYPVTGG